MVPYIFFGLAALLCTVYGIHYFRTYQKDKLKASDLHTRYQAAIAAGDRKQALELGREYYKTLRGGALTIYDEQALANDLSTIA